MDGFGALLATRDQDAISSMAVSISLITATPLSPSSPRHFHAYLTGISPPMAIFRRIALNRRRQCRRVSGIAAAALFQDTVLWSRAPVAEVRPAAESLFHVSVDVSESPHLATSYNRAGQYVQLRLPNVLKPSFLAIASPPVLTAASGVFEFLVKRVPGSTAERLCGLGKGDIVELSQAMGSGFNVDRISPPETYEHVLIFATGSAISPIRSLIESGFNTDKRAETVVYYGARNLQRMAYQERFKNWRSTGVEIIPVLSQPDGVWTGESGYLQAVFCRSRKIFSPLSTGAVLCGQKQMTEEITSMLVAAGVPADKILKNF